MTTTDRRARQVPRNALIGLIALALSFFGIRASADGAGSVPRGNAFSVPWSPPSVHVLSNGLTVITSVDRRAPIVSMRITHDAGARENGAHPYVAELTLRSMIDKTAHVPAGGYFDWLQRVGAVNSHEYVDLDSANEAVTIPSEAVATILWLWSDQMAFAGHSFSNEALERARAALRNARRVEVEGAPYGCVDGFINDALYPPNHPYRSAPSASMDAVRLDDVKDFYARHYAPNEAILSIVGDIDEAATLTLVRGYFESIAASARIAHPDIPNTLTTEKRIAIVADVDAPEVILAWPTAPYMRADDSELDVVAALLQGTTNSYLAWPLVQEKKLATYVSVHQASHALGSQFTIRVWGKPGIAPSALVSAVDEVLARLDEKRIAPTFFGSTNDQLRGRWLSNQRTEHRAATFASSVRLTRDPSREDKISRHVVALTASDAIAAMHRQLPGGQRVVVEVTPKRGAARCGELLQASEPSALDGRGTP